MKKTIFYLTSLCALVLMSCGGQSNVKAPEPTAEDTASVVSETTDTAMTAKAEEPATVEEPTKAEVAPKEEKTMIPTFEQVCAIRDRSTSVMKKFCIKKLFDTLHEYDDEIVGSIYYGVNAKVDKNGKFTATSDHAIIIQDGQGMEVSTLDIYFSNKGDYEAFLKTIKNTHGWHRGGGYDRDGFYNVSFSDSE